jgi:hypothetical protein
VSTSCLHVEGKLTISRCDGMSVLTLVAINLLFPSEQVHICHRVCVRARETLLFVLNQIGGGVIPCQKVQPRPGLYFIGVTRKSAIDLGKVVVK